MGSQLAQFVLPKKIMRSCQRIASARRAAVLLKKWAVLNLDCHNAEKAIASDVPKGHIPVYVGSHRRRFIIPATYLNHPLFRPLLEKAEEEFGFDHEMGFLIPCEEVAFECLISVLDAKKSMRFVKLTPLIDLEPTLIC